MIPLCLDQGVGIIPWSPLARGILARAGAPEATTRSGSDPRIEVLYGSAGEIRPILDRLAATARDRGVPPAQVALAWLLRQRGVTAPIVGATKDRHIEDAIAAITLDLGDDELAYLAEPYRPRPVIH